MSTYLSKITEIKDYGNDGISPSIACVEERGKFFLRIRIQDDFLETPLLSEEEFREFVKDFVEMVNTFGALWR